MNIHICFYDGLEKSAEEIVKSLSKNADVSLIIVMAERNITLDLLEEKSGTVYKFEHKATIVDNYDDIVLNLSSLIVDYKKKGQVFINISASAPLQAFAARYASLQNPVAVYFIDKNDIMKLIQKEPIPDLRDVDYLELCVLKQLWSKDYLSTALIIKKDGRDVSKKTRSKTLCKLVDQKLVESVKTKKEDVIDKSKRGPRPQTYLLSEIGKSFCKFNIDVIFSIEI